ncbi:hypothetical protein SBOR_1656 [Sclerotinia borealis F-4128]|uniref:Uncharacterized protein n=1 Tax=Sclerotinia borealis (strain F-4128) TaxID=1432307 RepID=W9CU00_SCLBF|nr:hypothetical protein SBOR_1656 [Sclerotinia borealis F-4128]
MSQVYILHPTTDTKAAGSTVEAEDISDYIPYQPRRDAKDIPPFNAILWLSTFYGQQVPPLPVVHPKQELEELPDQSSQETMEEYQLFTPTVKNKKLDLFTQVGLTGFPLIEKTNFNIVRNYPADEQYNGPQNLIWTIGNSYYTAVAWCVYGNWELWPRVKAQHRTIVNRVLADKNHPRHELYTELNQTRKGENNLNLKERLGTPYCAIRHEDIQQITADLYGILLVIFTYQPAVHMKGSEADQAEQHFAPSIRGDFNRPHKFIRFSIGALPKKFEKYPDAKRIPIWQIYEPMFLNIPAPARHSDFKYIRPTFINTRASLPAEVKDEDSAIWDGLNHPWRRVFGDRVPIPNPLTHPPCWAKGIPVPSLADLAIALGCHIGNPDDKSTWITKLPQWIRK